MYPDPYSVVILMEFEHQERLRHAAHQRLAASAGRGAPSLLVQMSSASQRAAGWLQERLPRTAVLRRLDHAQESLALLFAGLRAHRNTTNH